MFVAHTRYTAGPNRLDLYLGSPWNKQLSSAGGTCGHPDACGRGGRQGGDGVGGGDKGGDERGGNRNTAQEHGHAKACTTTVKFDSIC